MTSGGSGKLLIVLQELMASETSHIKKNKNVAYEAEEGEGKVLSHHLN